MKKISIVTAYFNRKQQLHNTLKSIRNRDDVEIIIVDDCSDPAQRVEDLNEEFDIKIIRLERENKWYVNPCVPFNIGFKEAKGDIVIIQNPECLHVNDVIGHILENLKENDYFSYAAYSINQNLTDRIGGIKDKDNYNENVLNILKPLAESRAPHDFTVGWYNHSIHKPMGFHFLSAIFRSKLIELGGFDEKFALGYAYDDNEFLGRARSKLNFKIIDNPFVVHQYHNKIFPANRVALVERNHNLLHKG